MPDDTRATDKPGNFADSLRTLGAACLEIAGIRFELATVEWQEQREYLKKMLLLAAICLLLFSAGLLLLALLIAIVFWDSHRLLAIGAVTGFYLSTGLAVLWLLRNTLNTRPVPFAATVSEFACDVQSLRAHPAMISTASEEA